MILIVENLINIKMFKARFLISRDSSIDSSASWLYYLGHLIGHHQTLSSAPLPYSIFPRNTNSTIPFDQIPSDSIRFNYPFKQVALNFRYLLLK